MPTEKQPSNEPFVGKEERPEVRLNPDMPVSEMRVRDLVEDELLLAIPLAPRHERCGGREAQAERGSREKEKSPFADLRGLIGGTKH